MSEPIVHAFETVQIHIKRKCSRVNDQCPQMRFERFAGKEARQGVLICPLIMNDFLRGALRKLMNPSKHDFRFPVYFRNAFKRNTRPQFSIAMPKRNVQAQVVFKAIDSSLQRGDEDFTTFDFGEFVVRLDKGYDVVEQKFLRCRQPQGRRIPGDNFQRAGRFGPVERKHDVVVLAEHPIKDGVVWIHFLR